MRAFISAIDNFNSHPPAEGDFPKQRYTTHYGNFNSHPPAEGDGRFLSPVLYVQHFNSHPPAEGDVGRMIFVNRVYNFNSHPPAEGDSIPVSSVNTSIISTHTLPRRATLDIRDLGQPRQFQLTPSRGGRPLGVANLDRRVTFQLTPSRGGRLVAYRFPLYHVNFNSHPPAEGDLYRQEQRLRQVISTHTLPRRATAV